MTVAVATAVAVTASASACLSLSLSLPQPQPQPASASASVCLQPRPQPHPASASACISLSLSLHQPSKCGPGMEFWVFEEHEVAYSWLRAFKIMPRNGVLGTRRPRSGLQLAPGIQNVRREWSSSSAKSDFARMSQAIWASTAAAPGPASRPDPPVESSAALFLTPLETYQNKLLGNNCPSALRIQRFPPATSA